MRWAAGSSEGLAGLIPEQACPSPASLAAGGHLEPSGQLVAWVSETQPEVTAHSHFLSALSLLGHQPMKSVPSGKA